MQEKESVSKLFEVNIGGLNLKLRSTHSDDFVRALTSKVNEKLKEVQSLGPEVSYQNSLILTALNLAEDFLLLKQKAFDDFETLENKSIEILSQLNTTTQSQLDN